MLYSVQDISEVASTQVRAIEAMQQSRDKEVTSLRQQLIDFQAQSDEKTVIGTDGPSIKLIWKFIKIVQYLLNAIYANGSLLWVSRVMVYV